MSSTPQKKKNLATLPGYIRNELRMCVALRGYDSLKQGSSQTVRKQYDAMQDYYHGKEPQQPSQINMLASGISHYVDLYTMTQLQAVTKNDSASSTSKLTLRDDLTLDVRYKYHAKEEINYLDLDKKNRTGRVLLTGRNILDMAKRGAESFRKAMAFAEVKWDLKENAPKESGTTESDAIMYVRQQMYKQQTKKSPEEEEDEESEGELASDLNQAGKTVDDGGYDIDMPYAFMFPGFMAFVLWGPFVKESDRLTMFLNDDAPKETVVSRKRKRKHELDTVNAARGSDNGNVREFSTDQSIQMQGLSVQLKRLKQDEKESALVALSILQDGLMQQIIHAENRAEKRCPDYDKENSYWQAVDELLLEQKDVTAQIKSFVLSATKPQAVVNVSDTLVENEIEEMDTGEDGSTKTYSVSSG